MFRSFMKLSTLEKVKKIALPVGVTTVVIAGYQGAKLRDAYNKSPKLTPPTGPTAGLEKWVDKMRLAKDELLDSIKNDDGVMSRGITEINHKFEEINHKIKAKLGEIEGAQHSTNYNPCDENSGRCEINGSSPDSTPYVEGTKKRKIKLLMLGDSLVAGVGNDDLTSSPILPKMIAKVLSKKYKADVEWFSSGVVGGTVVDLRNKVLPKIQHTMHNDRFTQTETEKGTVLVEKDEHIEYVVVIICGLNDWKDFFINFPTGLWPSKFRTQLTTLVTEIETTSKEIGSPCRIFLPNLPLVCIKGDPMYIMGVKPLTYFVDLFCYIWDSQKEYVSMTDRHTEYIGSPDPSALYATPGLGNVSSDGVHPSTQGYYWWAQHIAEQIVRTDPQLRDINTASIDARDGTTNDGA